MKEFHQTKENEERHLASYIERTSDYDALKVRKELVFMITIMQNVHYLTGCKSATVELTGCVQEKQCCYRVSQ